jgi:transcriptional regulator with XRE-family HTH domain
MRNRSLKVGTITDSGQILDALMTEWYRRGLSVPELAALMHVTPSTLHNLTARRRRGDLPPRMFILLAIADVLDLDIEVTLRRRK